MTRLLTTAVLALLVSQPVSAANLTDIQIKAIQMTSQLTAGRIVSYCVM
jgi:hypothetical protein